MRGGLFERAREDVAGRAAVVELQSLRGIAAIIVIIYHASLYFDYGYDAKFWMTVVLNAHAAVVSFFVLSGFVLILSLLRAPLSGRGVAFFYVRRAFRIYPALWVACAAAVLYFLVLDDGGLPAGATAWAGFTFAAWPISGSKLILSFAGLKPHLPVPIWSLAVELLASVAMPVIVWTMSRSVLAFAVLLAGLAMVSLQDLDRFVLVPAYLVVFAIGAGIALAVPYWRGWAQRRGVVAGGAVAGLALMWFARLFTGADFDVRYHQGLATILEGCGAALLIGTIYVRPDRFRPLAHRWATRLGDMSYSLYLLHLPVIGTLAMIGASLAPQGVAAHPGFATILLATGTLAATLPLSAWAFRHVEVPAIGLGQRLLRRIDARLARAVPPLLPMPRVHIRG